LLKIIFNFNILKFCFRRRLPRLPRLSISLPDSIPVEPEDDAALENLQLEIDEARRLEERLGLEIMDMLTDVTTPEGSDDDLEDDAAIEDVAEYQPPPERDAHDSIPEFFRAQYIPNDTVAYSILYRDPIYLSSARRKVRKVKHLALTCDLDKALSGHQFWDHYERLRALYPLDGGREDLTSLIALYCCLQSGEGEEDDELLETDVSPSEPHHDQHDHDHDPPPLPPHPCLLFSCLPYY
jgi:hypothetical protein